ncbi:hypothetical protein NIES2104_07470 [Leptolyngbya sp. NIES-2104]|nr:hypothetical protein NIES2104_07470 [Leptolyngbya sp. NIES-2104]
MVLRSHLSGSGDAIALTVRSACMQISAQITNKCDRARSAEQ